MSSYANSSHELTFKSRAGRRARRQIRLYAPRHLWQYQALRIAELIELAEADGKTYCAESPRRGRRRCRRVQGRRCARRSWFAAIRSSFPAPLSAGSRPRRSLRSAVVAKPALSRCSASLFGIAVYFAVRVFPLQGARSHSGGAGGCQSDDRGQKQAVGGAERTLRRRADKHVARPLHVRCERKTCHI